MEVEEGSSTGMGMEGLGGRNGLWKWRRGALYQDLPQVTPFSATGGPMTGDSVVPVSQAGKPRQSWA